MTEPHKIIELTDLEMRARDQAEASNSISARIAHLARADAYSDQIKGLKATAEK
ncbi:hypothetical protein [Sphingomonas sp. GB1N7]|uniref:hypothetical protein n=1 Tax=Parasphingomonas caseinilytica TaxID=3096158 RepID=UPI002FCABE77